jgi:hypothetical protein
MNGNETIKVIELRNYLIKPNLRDRFIDYFEQNFVESQNDLGGFVLDAFRIKDESDRFFWIRGFADMDSRSCFLPEFYSGEVWKQFGPEANEMMLEWHNVHLLKPLGEIKVKNFLTGKSLTVIDFYFAKADKLSELIDLLQNNANSSRWISEMTENDFPRLPVIQDGNLLAVMTNFKDEAEFESREKDLEIASLIKKRERLILSKAF